MPNFQRIGSQSNATNIIYLWFCEQGYNSHKVGKLLHISQQNVLKAMRDPQTWLSMKDLRIISSACQRPLIDVICAVLRDDVAEEALREKKRLENLNWYDE